MPGPAAVVRAPGKRRGGHSLLTSTEDLLTVAAIGDESASEPGRWEQGFQFLPNCGGSGGVWLPCGEGNPDEKVTPSGGEIVQWEPVEHYDGFRCSTWARSGLDMAARARDALDRSLARQVEEEFWTGERSTAAGYSNPFLASASATLVEGGVAQPVTQALAWLQQLLAESLGDEPGVIHAPRRLVSLWEDDYGIYRDVDEFGVVRLYDVFGNTVIGGSGYDGRGPGEAGPPSDDTLLWAYATPPVYHLLGDVEVYADEEWMVLNRAENEELWRAERVAAAAWAGCEWFAVQVDLCAECCESDGS